MSLFRAPENRHLGMDMVRAFAILTVLIGHALIFFPTFFSVNWLIYLAVFGVELFFALSGFLIGNILIRLSRSELRFVQVWQFWLKRWFRTVPAYLFIALLIMLVEQRWHPSYLFFGQNYFPEALNDFQVSWSLTIEEWFYLSFPLLMVALFQAGRWLRLDARAWLVPASALVFIAVPFVLRSLQLGADTGWDLSVRKQIPLRLDGIAYGVLLAWLYDRRQTALATGGHSVILGSALALGFFGFWWLYNRQIDIFTATPAVFNSLVFYPLINIYCAGFVAYFIRFRAYGSSKVQSLVLYLSLISYSLYLVHFHIYKYFAGRAESVPLAFVLLAVALAAMFIAGTALYKAVEQPFMRLRNRLTSGKVSTRL